VTSVVLPPKVFPLTVTRVIPQEFTVVLLRVTVGHCPKASDEIITKKVINRKTLVIFYQIIFIEYTTILWYKGSTIAKIDGLFIDFHSSIA
jgi:hypothetical protein